MKIYNIFTAIVKPFEKLFSLLLRPFLGNFAAPYRAKQPGKIKLNAAVISDVHMDSRKQRARKLARGLHDMEKSRTPNNILVLVGDTADRGRRSDWEAAEKVFAQHKPAERSFVVLGNHDRRLDDEYLNLFTEFSSKISGREIETSYFAENINGYTFITIAQGKDDVLGDTQMNWFKQQMEAASKSGLPIFVFMHESINVSHGLPYTWERRWNGTRLPDIYRSGIGVNSDEIEAILKQYKNVFFFSGHIHLGLTGKKQMRRFGYSSFESEGSFHRINVPCYMFPNHHGLASSGIGYQLEVYDDRVLIRPRSYACSVWYSRYDKEFLLK